MRDGRVGGHGGAATRSRRRPSDEGVEGAAGCYRASSPVRAGNRSIVVVHPPLQPGNPEGRHPHFWLNRNTQAPTPILRFAPRPRLGYFSTPGGVQRQAGRGSERYPHGHFRISSVPSEPIRSDMHSESDPRNRIAWQPETPMSKALWENGSLHEAIVSTTGSRSSEGCPTGMRARASLEGIVSILGMLLEPGGAGPGEFRLAPRQMRQLRSQGLSVAEIAAHTETPTAIVWRVVGYCWSDWSDGSSEQGPLAIGSQLRHVPPKEL
jgi:hypothetical protein